MAGDARKVLAVEDDATYRMFLQELLTQHNCEVITAENGKTGLEKAKAFTPDLIITDLKMDGMHGFDFCTRIIENDTLGHIPIIILTGVVGDENLINGLESGAVDYITKPVRSDILVMKIKNILAVREKFERKNWTHLLQKTFNQTELTEDEKFLQSVYSAVAANLGRYDFGVNDLALALNVSERTLYRRIKDLTGVPVAALIREVRLQHAQKLVANGAVKTTSELAARVGYKSAKQFNNAYKKRFGTSPQI